jgi:hypothetical protein
LLGLCGEPHYIFYGGTFISSIMACFKSIRRYFASHI